jgi:acyl-coenzyme A thioesterase PaaI-like protein
MTEGNWQPLDAEFERNVRESLLRQGFMQYLGAEMVHIRAGGCEIRVPFRAELTQQHGFFHAAVSGAIADSACSYARGHADARWLLRADRGIQTESGGPGRGPEPGDPRGSGGQRQEVKGLLRGRVAVQDGQETLCATSLSTIMTMFDRRDG